MGKFRLVINVSITVLIDPDIKAYGVCKNSVICWL